MSRCHVGPLARATVVAVLAVFCSQPASAQDSTSDSYPGRCGSIGPAAERGKYIALPHGDVFCPLIADPKATRSFVIYQRGNEKDLATDIGAVGIADQFPFFRTGAVKPGDGLQLGLAGAVFAQFDLGTSSYDLLNADYLIGVPLTFRAGPFSGRARIYHQSSHLGDELLARDNPPKRENLSFESAEVLLSLDVSALRIYGGGEDFVRRDPVDLPERLAHGGLELRPRANIDFGPLAVGRFVAAVDAKVVNDTTTRTGVSVRAGFEFGRPHDALAPSRRWSILAEYYNGPSPYGQFHREQVRLTGIGLHFTL
ncbi:MAG TPA: DUF1207 domain-containing protein [Gemmatimonadaceae bacterium]|nr:DUF1207 domain-containing protein [Gemmatimonadaceae bacterium]